MVYFFSRNLGVPSTRKSIPRYDHSRQRCHYHYRFKFFHPPPTLSLSLQTTYKHTCSAHNNNNFRPLLTRSLEDIVGERITTRRRLRPRFRGVYTPFIIVPPNHPFCLGLYPYFPFCYFFYIIRVPDFVVLFSTLHRSSSST